MSQQQEPTLPCHGYSPPPFFPQMLLQIADDFIESVVTAACQLERCPVASRYAISFLPVVSTLLLLQEPSCQDQTLELWDLYIHSIVTLNRKEKSVHSRGMSPALGLPLSNCTTLSFPLTFF